MYIYSVENEIYSRVKKLNTTQKEQLLDLIQQFQGRHSVRQYKRKAMSQIREALRSQAI